MGLLRGRAVRRVRRLVKLCADRWSDDGLKDIHYRLKKSKSVRNFAAHGACCLNGLLDDANPARPPASLVSAAQDAGIPRWLRSKWLRGQRMVQICSLMHLYAEIVPEGETRSAREEALGTLYRASDKSDIPAENPAIAALGFLKRLANGLGLLK